MSVLLKLLDIVVCGMLYIVVVLFGVGKSSIVNVILVCDLQIVLLIFFILCVMCLGEVNGQYYYFVSVEKFEQMIVVGDFFEYVWVYGDWKGMVWQLVELQLVVGQDVLLEIDWQGVQQVWQLVLGMVIVFILLLFKQVLQDCMCKCGQDSEVVIVQWLGVVCDEMLYFNEFDYVIVNEVFDIVVDELCVIFIVSCLCWEVQKVCYVVLIQVLLIFDVGVID